MAARLPADEPERLADLRAHAVLDTEAERDFDLLVEEASRLCEAPIALVSLLDEDRQWLKARVGLEAQEFPRELAFCGHAILESGLFTVPDAASDERFADNPLVAGAPNIRFYAGVPLRSAAGHALGTLCVIDRVPRALSEAQNQGLKALGERVVDELEGRRRLRALASQRPSAAADDPSAQTLRSSAQRLELPGGEPRRCGRFTIRRRIGQGAMATVYAAHDAELDREVAVKLLRGDGDAETRARVQREAQALARVSHPNVVQIFDIDFPRCPSVLGGGHAVRPGPAASSRPGWEGGCCCCRRPRLSRTAIRSFSAASGGSPDSMAMAASISSTYAGVAPSASSTKVTQDVL